MDDIDGRVNRLFSEEFHVPIGEVTDNLTMEEINAWDSLRHMELIVTIEQSFAIDLSFEEIVSMRSVGEIKRVLRQKNSEA